MASLRQMMTCIKLDPPLVPGAPWPERFWVVKDFFGYRFRGYRGAISLLEQVRAVRGKHFHVNLIRVGVENFTNADEKEIDEAVQRTRKIFAQPTVKLGIGRVRRFYITEAKANEELGIYDSVLADDEAKEITDDFSAEGHAVDVFLVRFWALPEFWANLDVHILGTLPSGTLGRSDVDGSCDKSYDVFFMTGAVVSIQSEPQDTARTLAHEIAHYLGLSHEDGDDAPKNLMTQSKEAAEPVAQSVELTSEQGQDMRDHCFIRPGC
jgi:hypothetical protein